MTDDQISIPFEAIDAHAGEVSNIAKTLGEARAAVVSTIDPQAFGIMCAGLVAPAVAGATAGIAQISAAQFLLDRIADALHGTHQDMRHTESGHIVRISALGAEL